MKKYIDLPFTDNDIDSLKVGDELRLRGELYVGRDQAHQRLCHLIEKNEEFPFPIEGATLFYMGPSPTPVGRVIGSAGPTTAGRMDPFAPILLEKGLKGMIAKGDRQKEVYEGIKKNKALYLYAFGGCGALYSQCIKETQVVAFEDLGPEALLKIRVEDFPVIVAIDSRGESIYTQ